MSIPQLGYKFIRPLYSTERPGAVGGRVGAELSASGSLSSVLSSMYGAPFANTHGYSAFLPYSSDLSILNQLGSQYEFKDSPGVQHAGFPHAAFYPYGHQYHFEDPSRPKNATRESTSTLKAWLSEHRKNPYPTKGEKIMLAIITKMTLTQVSTWFANARRRLKKENKMSWTPRNRSEDEDEEDSIDLEKNDDDDEPIRRDETTETIKDSVADDRTEIRPENPHDDATKRVIIDCEEQEKRTVCDSPVPTTSSPGNEISETANPTPKPKLWSLAEIATSDKGCAEPSQTSGASPAQCPFPPRHLYYAPPFYPAFTNYGTFGHLNGVSHGHSTQLNGINTGVLHRARDGNMTLDLCKELSFEHKRANI